MGRSIVRYVGVALWLGLSCVHQALAVEVSDRVELHGYGSQDYLQASSNAYLGADERGSWDNNLISLVGTVTLNEKSKFWAQLESVTGEPLRFNWFFVDYQLNDRLRLQVGRVKLPLGIYNEIINARYLQLSALPPALYQSAADMTHDAFQGIGLDYESQLGAAGSLRTQVWGGNTVAETPDASLRDRRAFGGKLTWSTPLDGLKLMATAFRIQIEILADHSMQKEDHGVLSLDYLNRGFDIKSEYAKHTFQEEKKTLWYLQAGYTLAGKWTPYVRYDSLSTQDSQDADPSSYQKTVAIGLGYRISSNFGMRVEDHLNRGYALPVASGEIATGAGRKNWNLFVASVNFIF